MSKMVCVANKFEGTTKFSSTHTPMTRCWATNHNFFQRPCSAAFPSPENFIEKYAMATLDPHHTTHSATPSGGIKPVGYQIASRTCADSALAFYYSVRAK